MKDKIIKIFYIIITVFLILLIVFLIIRPRHKEVQYAEYDTTNEIGIASLGSEVSEQIYIDNDSTFKFLIFLNGDDIYDNLYISLSDSKGNMIVEQKIKKIESNSLYIQFPMIKKNSFYTFKIIDLDGDNLELPITSSNKNEYLLNNHKKMLQTVTYYYDTNYMYLWYPMFALTLLFIIYPFIWEDDKNEKK